MGFYLKIIAWLWRSADGGGDADNDEDEEDEGGEDKVEKMKSAFDLMGYTLKPGQSNR